MAIPAYELDVGILAANLQQRGIPYLRVKDRPDSQWLDTETFLAALAQHTAPRVREALIPLFLRHPEYAQYVPEIVSRLPVPAATTLMHMYTASVYLQRLWRGKLGIYLGEFPILPDYYGQSQWNLPAPDVHCGEAGLRALATHFKGETGYNWLSLYESAVNLLFNILQLEATNKHN